MESAECQLPEEDKRPNRFFINLFHRKFATTTTHRNSKSFFPIRQGRTTSQRDLLPFIKTQRMSHFVLRVLCCLFARSFRCCRIRVRRQKALFRHIDNALVQITDKKKSARYPYE